MTPASSWRGRRHEGPVPGPAERRPPPAGPGPPARRVRAVGHRRGQGPDHRRASVTVTCHDGTSYGGSYRLATTLLDHRAYPGGALISLYHERWEHEITYLALRHTLLGGRVLRSGDPAGLEQEMWALLALYQALRIAITDAVETVPGTDPDRASYQIAVETAQTLVTGARNIAGGPRPGRRHRPRRPGQPARAPPAPRLRPPGQIPAQPLEQAPARQTPHQPADHQGHHRDPPRRPARTTHRQQRDNPSDLNPPHCGELCRRPPSSRCTTSVQVTLPAGPWAALPDPDSSIRVHNRAGDAQCPV